MDLSPFLFHKKEIVNSNLKNDQVFTFIEYLRKCGKRIIRYDQLYYIILTQLRKLIYEHEAILSKEYPEFFKESPFVFSSKPRTETLITSNQLLSWLYQKFRNLPHFVELLDIDTTEIAKLSILSVFIGKIIVIPEVKTVFPLEDIDYIVVDKNSKEVYTNLMKLAEIFPLFKEPLTRIANRIQILISNVGDPFTDFIKINESQQQVSGWITELYLRDPKSVLKFGDLNDTSSFDVYNIETKKTFTHNFGIFSYKTIGLFELGSFGQVTVLNN